MVVDLLPRGLAKKVVDCGCPRILSNPLTATFSPAIRLPQGPYASVVLSYEQRFVADDPTKDEIQGVWYFPFIDSGGFRVGHFEFTCQASTHCQFVIRYCAYDPQSAALPLPRFCDPKDIDTGFLFADYQVLSCDPFLAFWHVALLDSVPSGDPFFFACPQSQYCDVFVGE